MTRVRGLATVWEGCFGSISAVAVTDSMSWCSFRDALSPCIEDYQFYKGGRSIYHTLSRVNLAELWRRSGQFESQVPEKTRAFAWPPRAQGDQLRPSTHSDQLSE